MTSVLWGNVKRLCYHNHFKKFHRNSYVSLTNFSSEEVLTVVSLISWQCESLSGINSELV